MARPPAPGWRCWPPWSAAARASSATCSRTCAARASPTPARTAPCTGWRSPRPWPAAPTTTSASSWSARWRWTRTTARASPTPWRRPCARRTASCRSTCTPRRGRREPQLFSEHYACAECGINIPELEPRQFSFNSPYGACPACGGLGTRKEPNPELVLADSSLSILEGVVLPWGVPRGHLRGTILQGLADALGFDLNTPWDELGDDVRQVLMYGVDGQGRGEGAQEDQVGRHRARRGAALPRQQQRLRARDAGGVHEHAPLRRVPGCAAAAGEPGRDHRRAVAWATWWPCPWPSRWSSSTCRHAAAHLARHRRAHPQGGARAAVVPGQRGAGVPDAGALGRDAERRRGAAHPPGHADRLAAGGRAVHPG